MSQGVYYDILRDMDLKPPVQRSTG
jgi:hypothetical protein